LVVTLDGKRLISSSYDHTIRVWDMEAQGKGSETVPLNARTREDLKRRGSSKVPAAIEAKVAVQKSATTLEGHREWVTAMVLSKDGKLLVSGDDDGQVISWSVSSSWKEEKRQKLKGWVYALALSPDQKQLLASERVPLVFDSGRLTGLKLWDRTTSKMTHDLGPLFKDQNMAAAAWSPDGKVVAVGRGGEANGMTGVVHFIDPATGKKLRTTSTGHEYGVTDLAFHPDGKHLASSGRDTTVKIWNISDGKLVKQLGKPRGGQFKDWLHAVTFSADGAWMAAGDMAGAVQVWSLKG
jgi:WD40 repeat protein